VTKARLLWEQWLVWHERGWVSWGFWRETQQRYRELALWVPQWFFRFLERNYQCVLPAFGTQLLLAPGTWRRQKALLAWKGQRYCFPEVLEPSTSETDSCWQVWRIRASKSWWIHASQSWWIRASRPLCAPFLQSCETMDFAETRHRREERPDVPRSLLMVLHALHLECEKSMDSTASSHFSCFFCSSQKSRDEAVLSESVPTGSRMEERLRVLHALTQHGT